MKITREVAKELLPFVQALAEGKMIQDKIEGVTDWCDTEEINLEFEGQKILHRIKPIPEYRPFKNQKELWEEMHKHPDFGWVKMKHNGIYSNISMMKSSCGEETIMVANSSYNLAHAFKFFTFADGAPFGMVEE